MFNRPSWMVATAVQSNSGLVHIVRSWNAYLGTQTRCGRWLKNWQRDWYVPSLERRTVLDGIDGRPCPRCLPPSKDEARDHHRNFHSRHFNMEDCNRPECRKASAS